MSISSLQHRALLLLSRIGWPLGCALLATIFIPSGLDKLFSPEDTAATTASAGLPSFVWLVLLVGLFEIAAGGSLAIGYKRTVVAVLLLAYISFVTPVFHRFWNYDGAERSGQMVQFLKNAAIWGGLLFVATASLTKHGDALRFLARLAVAAIFFANAFGIVSQERATHELIQAGAPANLAPALIRAGQITQAVAGILLLLPQGGLIIIGALLLAGFLAPATLIAHSFWIAPPEAFTFQLLNFCKNVSAIGALILIAGWYARWPRNKQQPTPLARYEKSEVKNAP